ncbi:uncharacterized membrane protein YfbV (UPF0208 family) [Streptomyces griseochromogenes]|uniref:Uncharacterized membrane protein YfbV (UPF0208 family) n=1 Tax=Streptomyces griseochromogenes TaxID=68214 RepID=A0ABS4LT41_9ACTN|nr:hypothetical protein [Streptomyces griseochromogenes]MBP2050576.1 uncharacterized membrane protein YfbV (UPF0208 family) [Streptomyces griseochromogenes]
MIPIEIYKSSKKAAAEAHEALFQALLAIGIPRRDLGWLAPRVAPDGRPMVAMGTWNADVVQKVAGHLMASPAHVRTSPDGRVVADHTCVTREE